VLHSFAGRGGLPVGVTRVLLSADLCALGQIPNTPGGPPRQGEGGVVAFGWEEFDSFDSQNLTAGQDCMQSNGQFVYAWLPGDPVHQFETSQLWLQTNGAQEIRLRTLQVRSLVGSSLLIRMRLIGWSE